MAFLLFLGVLLIFVSPISIWLDRRNFVVWMNLPMLIIAYGIPLLVYSERLADSYKSYDLYILVVFFGALSYLFGCFLGKYVPSPSLGIAPVSTLIGEQGLIYRNSSVCFWLLLFSCLSLSISYVVMGFVPMFADEPLLAKFFKGPYKEPYERVAILFRLGTTIIPLVLPMAIICIHRKFSFSLLLLILTAFILMSLSLLRGAIGSSVIIGVLVIILFRFPRNSFVCWLIYFFVYCFGSAIMWLLGLAGGDTASLIVGILSGAPDLTDQLSFLDAFERNPEFTYGLTFVGGLIPWGFKWNPSVYTLSVLNATGDIDDIASGGFRMLSPLWGYISFGYLGVLIVPFLHGVFTAFQVRFMRFHAGNEMTFIMSYLYSSVFIGFFVNFFTMSMYSLPLMFLVFSIFYIHRHKLKIIDKGDYDFN